MLLRDKVSIVLYVRNVKKNFSQKTSRMYAQSTGNNTCHVKFVINEFAGL